MNNLILSIVRRPFLWYNFIEWANGFESLIGLVVVL